MSNYNFGVGLNESVLNRLSREVYSALYPRFFSGKLQVNRFNVAQIAWNITEAPVFDLKQSDSACAEWRKSVAEGVKNDKELASEIQDYLANNNIWLSLTVPAVDIQIQASGGGESPALKISVQIDCRADITPDNRLVFDILAAHADTSGEPMMEWLINNLLVPELTSQLEKTLLKGVELPTPASGDIRLSTPDLTVENDTLLAYFALQAGAVVAPPKTGGNWPPDKCFVLADNDFLAAAAADGVTKLKESGTAETKILNLRLSAGYTVGLANPRVHTAVGSALTMGVDASGTGTAKAVIDLGIAKIPITLGLTITASPEVRASLGVDDKNRLVLSINQVLDFKVAIDFRHVPKIVEKFISQIISFLGKPVSQLIAGLLKGKQFPIVGIPTFPVAGDGVSMDVILSQLSFADITDTEGKTLFMASGDVNLAKKTASAS